MPKTIEELREIEEQMQRVTHRLRHEGGKEKYCEECGMTTPHRKIWKPVVQNGLTMNVVDWECAVCWYLLVYLPAVED